MCIHGCGADVVVVVSLLVFMLSGWVSDWVWTLKSYCKPRSSVGSGTTSDGPDPPTTGAVNFSTCEDPGVMLR